jgi:SAM-dependent methyltransferase
MSVREEFDEWAADGRDRGMEQRHWHTAKDALARMPVEPSDTVLDLGTGSGYALRALAQATGVRGYGLDASPAMLRNARSYTASDDICYLRGTLQSLPLATDSVDHAWSMEAFYYAADPTRALEEVRRVLRPGGTFYCAVNYFAESGQTREWAEHVDVPMTRWSQAEYRGAFSDAGLFVAAQDTIPDREIDIPPEEAFPTEDWDRREAMVDRYRTWGTLLTVGVAPE